MTHDDGKTKDTLNESGAADDTTGHSLLLDTDYYIARKPRGPELERGAHERRPTKEARPNKPQRR